jgi:hypothetical protein
MRKPFNPPRRMYMSHRPARTMEEAAPQQPPKRHPVIRSSPRLVIGIVLAMALAAAATSVGVAVSPSSKAQAVGATKVTMGHPRSASSMAVGPFSWLALTTPPATWTRLAVPSDLGIVSWPPGFRRVDGDPGTLTGVLLNSAGTYLGYINVTPHQGHETLQDWAAFRLTHLRSDDAVSAHEDAMVQSVRTAAAVRSCVIDDYVTYGGHRFHEVACDVTNGSVSSVVVAATPSGDPAHVWTQLERRRGLSAWVARSQTVRGCATHPERHALPATQCQSRTIRSRLDSKSSQTARSRSSLNLRGSQR